MDAEHVLWQQLSNHPMSGFTFRRQAPIGPYIVDFVCFSGQLVVELDRGHHTEAGTDDASRTAWLESQGFRVLRFGNYQVLTDLDAIRDSLLKCLQNPFGLYPCRNSPPQYWANPV